MTADLPPEISTTQTEYALVRDGQVVTRLVVRSVGQPHPNLGGIVAASAPGFGPTVRNIGDRRVAAQALAAQEGAATARVWMARKGAQARAMVAGLWGWLKNSRAFRWVANVFSWLGRQASAAAGKLGKRGMFAAITAVVTSKSGQQLLGAVLERAVRFGRWCVDTVVGALTWPFRKIPFTKGFGESIVRGKQHVYTTLISAWNSGTWQEIIGWLRYDSPLVRPIHLVSKPLSFYFIISRFVPGWWKVPAYIVAIILSIPRDGWGNAGEWWKRLWNETDEEPWTGATNAADGQAQQNADRQPPRKAQGAAHGNQRNHQSQEAAPQQATADATTEPVPGPQWRPEQAKAAEDLAKQVMTTVTNADWQKANKADKKKAITAFTTDGFRLIGPQGRQLQRTQAHFADALVQQFDGHNGVFEPRENLSDSDANGAMLLALKELVLESVHAVRGEQSVA